MPKEGYVYFIHFKQKIGNPMSPHGQAQHYFGFTLDLDERLKEHRGGYGAKIMEYLAKNKIPWMVVKVWEGKTRSFERSLKKRKCAPRICPVCTGKMKETYD